MRRRYLAAWHPEALPAQQALKLRSHARDSETLVLAVDTPNLIILADRALPIITGEGLTIVGSIFARGQTARMRTVGEPACEALVRSRGTLLTEIYWGSYVAFLPDPSGQKIDLVRAPLGDLGCYYQKQGGSLIVASDAALLRDAIGMRYAIAWDALERHLALSEIVTSETCLTGLSELRGGDSLTLRRDTAWQVATCWSPWSFAGGDPDRVDAIEAARRVRDAVLLAVKAAASDYDRVVLLLSGGLDSSIVAACLAQAGQRFSCMTLVTPDGAGDERRYARLAADAAGAALAEIYRDPAGVDLSVSLAAQLPRPGARSFTQETDRRALALAAEQGAGAIFDGGGGDNVFCSHRSVAAVADCLLTEGVGPRFNATASALGGLTQASLFTVARRAMLRAWFRPTRARPVCDTDLLTASAAAVARARPDHPWLVPPKGALPGEAIQVSLLASAQGLIESSYPSRTIDRVSPLVTQPVAEACLRVPSWLWFAPGHDRAAARQAFANMLPAQIIDRRSKGTPAAFAASLIDVYRDTLRPLLLDGQLAANGVIDSGAVRTLIDDPTPPKGFAFGRLLQLADAEAWARCWA
jgi:asparagine synthase (glutamine-hydrolysing)